MTSTLPEVSGDAIARDPTLALRLDLVVIALLIVLLLEYDIVRVYFPRRPYERLKPFGVALVPLTIAFAIVVASRWWELR